MSDPAPHPAPPLIDDQTPFDARAVEAVVARGFGPGRHAKTAARLREGARPVLALVARDGRTVVGSVRLWTIRIGDVPALFLGPIAVEPEHRLHGLGARLVEAAMQRGGDLDAAGVLLVGDMGFFGRMGFDIAKGPILPGPVEPGRLLWRGLGPDPAAGAPSGPVRAA